MAEQRKRPVRGVLLDIGGVLYTGDTALPGACEAVARLRRSNLALHFLTNTTSSPKRAVLEKLARMGFDVAPDELFTPAAAARDWLVARAHTPWLLVAKPLLEDFPPAAAEPDTVVVGDAGAGFTYDALNRAFRRIMAGAPLVALAKNRYFMRPEGLTLDAGAFVTALEFASGVEATVLGKPSPAFFAAALDSMGCMADEVLMIGDDWESDVNGAVAAGLRAVLVKTGKYRDGDEARLAANAGTAADIAEAVDMVLGERN